MGTRYVKLENGHLRPMPLFTDGVCNLRPDRAQWRIDNGWLPLEQGAPAPECDCAHHAVRTGWAYDSQENPTRVVPVYTIKKVSVVGADSVVSPTVIVSNAGGVVVLGLDDNWWSIGVDANGNLYKTIVDPPAANVRARHRGSPRHGRNKDRRRTAGQTDGE